MAEKYVPPEMAAALDEAERIWPRVSIAVKVAAGRSGNGYQWSICEVWHGPTESVGTGSTPAEALADLRRQVPTSEEQRRREIRALRERLAELGEVE